MEWNQLTAFDPNKYSYSQNRQDLIIENILSIIEAPTKIFVDVGAGDGQTGSNSRRFLDLNWQVFNFDGAYQNDYVIREFFTLDNCISIFEKYKIPSNIDVLSIDIDGNDFWILSKLLEKYRPRVICNEFNGAIPRHVTKTIVYNPNHMWDGSDYYGASFSLFMKLAEERNYAVVLQWHNQDMFWVDKSFIPQGVEFDVQYKVSRYHAPDFQCRPWVYYE